jgi:LysM repeat protein
VFFCPKEDFFQVEYTDTGRTTNFLARAIGKVKVMINKTPKTPPPAKKPDKPLRPVTLPQTKPPATLISSYRKRQQMGPFILWSLVLLLVFSGIILLVVWLASGNGPKITLFATETPTPTVTPSPTSTSTLTPTSTQTETPTITPSPTPDKPFNYTVVEGDTLDGIAKKFNLGDNGIPLLLLLNPTISAATLRIGDIILVPNPDMPLPTETPIPVNLPRGTKLDYTIQAGDTIAGIASKFNSTAEDILKENSITDANKIQVGQVIVVRANLVTPTASPQPTITPGPSVTPPSPFTPTPPGGVAPTAAPTATP